MIGSGRGVQSLGEVDHGIPTRGLEQMLRDPAYKGLEGYGTILGGQIMRGRLARGYV